MVIERAVFLSLALAAMALALGLLIASPAARAVAQPLAKVALLR